MAGQPEKNGAYLIEGSGRQRLDILATAELFQGLHPDLLSRIAAVAEDRTLPQQSVAVRQGEQGDAFWIVIAGRVRVYRTSEEGEETDLAVLEPGDGFGEMALLTGEPRSASVSTLQPSRFLVVAKPAFDKVVAANPELSAAFTKILAERLSRGNIHLARATVTGRAYRRFVSEYQSGPQLRLVGASSLFRKFLATVAKAAATRDPVLVQGPPGTEKRGVGWHLHRAGPGDDHPFLVVDAKTVSLGGVDSAAVQHGSVQRELAQDSALFGHVQGALPFMKNNRLGVIQVADQGTLVIDNVESLTSGVQVKLADFIRTGRFLPLGNGEARHSSVRLVVCSSADLATLVGQGRFDGALFDLLQGQTLEVPSLGKRKKDLRLLVDYLIEHHSMETGKQIDGITQQAYREIMAYDWPGNLDELAVVIRRAVAITTSRNLQPDDLFIGLAPVRGALTFDLLGLARVRQLFLSRLYPVVPQVVTALFFLLVLLLGLFGTQEPDRNIALTLTWGLWEPLVVVSAVLVARVWCGVCPIGACSSLVSRTLGLKRQVPVWVRSNGLYLGALGLAVIIWAEVASDMLSSPKATALLVLAILLPAVALGLLFQRRVWCRFICPLGNLVGILSTCSLVEMRANDNICNNDCKTHGCYVGTSGADGRPAGKGCPMFEGPFSLHSNVHCILCGNCVKNCQHHSPRLNIRLPAHELWTVRQPERAMVLFVPVFMATQIFRGLADGGFLPVAGAGQFMRWTVLAAVLGLIALACVCLVRSADALFFRDVHSNKAASQGKLAYGLVFLAAAFEVGHHLERFLSEGGQIIPVLGRQLGYDWQALGGSVASWEITVLLFLLLLVGSLASQAILKKLLVADRGDDERALPRGWRWAVLIPTALYFWLQVA